MCTFILNGCTEIEKDTTPSETVTTKSPPLAVDTEVKVSKQFTWKVDKFDDIQILRYQVPGFESLPIEKKTLLYYLTQAGLAGRDIIWDQNYKHNLTIRHLLETILAQYKGDRNTPDFVSFTTYVKKVWFANGIHHHYMAAKFIPEFSQASFSVYLKSVAQHLNLPSWDLLNEKQLEEFTAFIMPILFDPTIDAKKTDLSKGVDNVKASAVNFYENVSEQEVADFYQTKIDEDPKRPISWGLNSKLIKENGNIYEKVWMLGGMYSNAIEKIIYWLEKAVIVAENEQQKSSLQTLIKYYRSGDLADFDEYNVKWVKDIHSDVDVINGFIEVYSDPLAYRGSFESVVSVIDVDATKVISALAAEAQWFEDNSPLFPDHKKAQVKGITGKAINVVSLAGETHPSSPIGINLPNANWIRAEHGSKSVSLANIVNAYDNVRGGSLSEFAWDENEISRSKTFGPLASHIHTDLHEVIGHASGQINPGVGTTKETLKQYASTLEEARADLIALYYLLDQKLVDMNIIPSLEVAKAGYDSYIRNGLIQQLRRLKLGENIEEAHMRNRQLVAAWVYEKGLKDNVIEKRIRERKTYFVITNYPALRILFGDLLREIQRIKSEGDYMAGQNLVENYGVKVDPILHKEVLGRYKTLNLSPYSGFINPLLEPIYEDKKIVDVKIHYPTNYSEQMLQYSKEYGYLPLVN